LLPLTTWEDWFVTIDSMGRWRWFVATDNMEKSDGLLLLTLLEVVMAFVTDNIGRWNGLFLLTT
jgi:hypothetical protein